MAKFFNIILLNLVIFSKKYHFDAFTINTETLSKIPFEIEDSLPNEIQYFPRLQKRNFDYEKTPVRLKSKGTDVTKAKRYLKDLNNSPLRPYQNIQLYYVPPNEGPEISFKPSDRLNTPIKVVEENAKCMKDGNRKWKNFMKRKRKKRVSRFLADLGPEKPIKFLDYTNSQMPFNEGMAQHKRFRKKNSEVLDDSSMKGKKSFANGCDPYLESELERYKFGSSLTKRSELPLRAQEENFKMLGDDSILKYSRVRRFLDHERAKKRKRMSNTLEDKEAAMSRVLDPNVNLEGILEPHVRKRRGQNIKKRDLSFTQKYKKRLRSKRRKSKYSDN